MTPDLNNLSNHSEYIGNDNLIVASGKGLSISNSGSSHYLSNRNIVSLHNVLDVLNISQNLLSVSWFTKDNDCYFVFTFFGFYVKENKMGKILFRGVTSNGLYPPPFELMQLEKINRFLVSI